MVIKTQPNTLLITNSSSHCHKSYQINYLLFRITKLIFFTNINYVCINFNDQKSDIY